MSAKPASHAAKRSSSQRGFEEEHAQLEALSAPFATQDGPNAAQVEHLRKALAHRSNFIVAKAAKLVVDAEIAALLPEVLAAFDRFFIDAAKSDPKCWGKEALAKALVKLEHRSKEAYLRG